MAALFMVTSGWKHPNDHQQHSEQIATLRNGIKSSRKANVICEIMDGSLLEKEVRAQTVQLRQQLHSEGIFNLLVEKHEGGFWVMKMSYILIWVVGI